MKRSVTLLSILAWVGSVSLMTGCSQSAGTQRPAGPTVAEQVQKIQNDPSMPPQAKAIAIQQLQARQGGAGGGGTTGK